MFNETLEGGLVWSPLFSISKEERDRFLKKHKQYNQGYSDKQLHSFVYEALHNHGYDYADKEVCEAIKIAILKQLIFHSSFAEDVLNDEDYKKAKDTYKRGQYNNGVLKELIGLFLCARNNLINTEGKPVCMENNHFYLLLYSDIETQISIIKEKKIEKDFAPLKKIIEKIASGVKADCYLNATKTSFDHLNVKLNDYITDTYGYDFLKASGDTEYRYTENFKGKINELLQLSLIDNKDFWANKKFKVAIFLNEVYENNSEKHAYKIVDYIFEVLKKDENINKLIEKGLSIGFSDINTFKKKFKDYATFKNFNYELFYPLFEVEKESEKIQAGKEIFEKFLYGYVYKNDKEKVRERLLKNLKEGTVYTIFGTLNFNVLNYNICDQEEKALSILMPEFFTVENMWKRVYLKAYYMSKETSTESLNDSLFNCFFNLFELLYEDIGVETSVQLDKESRENGFKAVRNMLKRNGVIASLERGDDYVSALLDRKSATLREASRFPVLEQLGDAIYGFAIAEMIFYNPYYNDYGSKAKSAKQRFEEYVCASTQVEIAKKYQIDKMYISASSVLCKYDTYSLKRNYIDFEEFNRRDDGEKYLADSLEMILGAVCLDKGHDEAITLAKKLIRETFPNDFDEEVRFGYEKVVGEEINKDYFARIRPGLYSILKGAENSINQDYCDMMRDALYKLLGCLILKTTDKDTRWFISGSLYDVFRLFGDMGYCYEIAPSYYCYLTEGLNKVIEVFGDSVLKKYNEKNKK